MTKFNPENKKTLNYGECLEPAMKITDAEDAKQYKKDYIAFVQGFLDKKPNESGSTAEEIVNSNLGYFAGYYDNATRERVERLFICKHPIFGAIAEKRAPSPTEALNMGIERGKNHKNEEAV